MNRREPQLAAPTLPIIGSRANKWNAFSIFIFDAIFLASPGELT